MRSLRSLQTLLTLLSLTLLVGCGEVTIGPRTSNEVVFVDKYDPVTGVPIKIGVVKKNVKVPIKYETDDKRQFEGVLDIGGWSVSPPPLPTPLEAAPAKTVPSFATDAVPQYAFHVKVGFGHGTAFSYQGMLVTCAHVMDGKNSALVWNGAEWIDAALVKIDNTADVAFLMPSSNFLPPNDIPAGFVCVARNGKLDIYQTLTITSEKDGFCTMKGFDHGASGSPVFKDGKLYGMARGIKQRQNWRKRMVRTDDIEVVPIETINSLIPPK